MFHTLVFAWLSTCSLVCFFLLVGFGYFGVCGNGVLAKATVNAFAVVVLVWKLDYFGIDMLTVKV